MPCDSVVLANGVEEGGSYGRGVNRQDEAVDLETVVGARYMSQVSAGGGDKCVVPLIGEYAAAIVLRYGVVIGYIDGAEDCVTGMVAERGVGKIYNGLYLIGTRVGVCMPYDGTDGCVSIAEVPVEIGLVGVAVGVECDFVVETE